jgi:hypothetical protein
VGLRRSVHLPKMASRITSTSPFIFRSNSSTEPRSGMSRLVHWVVRRL